MNQVVKKLIYREETVETEMIYNGKVINVKRDKVKIGDDLTSYRELVEHNGGVCILAVNEKREILMVKQYRKPFDEILLELPAGKLEKDEKPEDCAIRELEEETGFKPLKLYHMHTIYPSPGFCNEKLYLYFCNEMVTGKVNPDEDEFVEVETILYEDAVKMIFEGKIKDAKSIVGIFMAKKFF